MISFVIFAIKVIGNIDADGNDASAVTELEISLLLVFFNTVKRGDNPARPSQGNLVNRYEF